MAKFHINNEDELHPCIATKQDCEFGPETHFEGKKEAVAGLNHALKKKHDEISTVSRKITNDVFVMQNWNGSSVNVKAGERTAEAMDMLLYQQHLGLAVEVAKKNGSNKVAVLVEIFDTDVQETDENGDAVMDHDGEPVYKKSTNVLKSYAVGADGYTLWDAEGASDPSYVDQLVDGGADGIPGAKLEYLKVDEAVENYSRFLPDQNFEFARSFVDGVMARGIQEKSFKLD